MDVIITCRSLRVFEPSSYNDSILPKMLLTSERKTFAAHMDHLLYGPDGYYSSGRARSGREGDYFTAADTGPLFGQLLAKTFERWKQQTQIQPFHLIEAGPGEGALVQSIRNALKDHEQEFPYTAVERSPVRRAKLEAMVPTVSDLESLTPRSGCLFGNELLDAFPVHRVRIRDGKLQEAYVDSAKPLLWDDPSTPALQAYLDRLAIDLPEGYETEINLAMESWFQQAARVLQSGILLIIDYGWPARDYYAPERERGTLRTFRRHRVDAFASEESADITADVDFTSAALAGRAAGFVPLGFQELGSFLLNAAEAMDEKALTRQATALQYLIHPEGMGSAFQVLVLAKGVPALTLKNNRLQRLGLDRTRKD
jgi:SAM-dependent MidA family methyltransferase